jgi:phosphoglycerate dehydrogenase-like enzyme
MTAQTPVQVYLGPEGQEWYEAVAATVRDAGAELVAPADAGAVIWLSNKAEDGLDEILHDGIEWVQLRSAGVDRWVARGDLDADRQWTAARGIYADSVAEHTLALVLAGLKLLPSYARARTWDPAAKDRGRLLRDATVVVVGAGGIGQEFIRYLGPIGPRVIAVTRSGRVVEGADEHVAADQLATVLPHADVLVLAAPATPGTKHLIGLPELEAMPADGLLVNIARGSLIDTDALVDGLRRELIGGAALDVTEPEPLPDGHPLWDDPRVLITPHAANPGSAQLPRLCRLVAENLQRFAAGEPLVGRVDLDAGY